MACIYPSSPRRSAFRLRKSAIAATAEELQARSAVPCVATGEAWVAAGMPLLRRMWSVFALAAAAWAASTGCGPSRGGAVGYHPVLEKEFALFKSSARHVSYPVKPGDTLWSLSRQFGITVGDIIEANGISEVASLKTGQVLKIPMGSGRAVLTASSESTRGLVWPVRGNVITAFGQTKGRLKSSGIDIRTKPKAQIVAPGNGIVRKAGPFVGLGKTVVIQHDKEGRVITLCGRVGKLAVSEGDSVRKGQTIAFASSGAAGTSVIHFRMFKKGVPVDPRKYLP